MRRNSVYRSAEGPACGGNAISCGSALTQPLDLARIHAVAMEQRPELAQFVLRDLPRTQLNVQVAAAALHATHRPDPLQPAEERRFVPRRMVHRRPDNQYVHAASVPDVEVEQLAMLL